MHRHRGRHRRRSIRLRGYDYAQAGYYYVTIRVEDGRCLFGEVVNGEMHLNRLGLIALRCWLDIPKHYSNVDLDLFIFMPNHLHGIIHITDPRCQRIQTGRGGVTPPLQKLRSPTLCDMIGYFKYRSTKLINQLSNSPGKRIWQRSFHDHIIRNDTELNRIREYILNNPLKWHLDRNTPPNW
jgi:REP element-mobilizing transposase RayT